MAVAGTDEHQWAEHAAVGDLACLHESRMEAVVEPGLHDALVLLCRRGDSPHLGERAARRLLDQHVAAGLHGAERDRGELVVRGSDDYGVDIGGNGLAPIRDGTRARLLRKLASAHRIAIAHDDDLMPGGRRGAFAPDQAASDDREAHHFLSHGSPRSPGTMRRKV